ncbi:MAG: monovalent cation/H+ antiporter subunit A [Sterolibacterium sp.]|nr:monovalent cation/H+ antiporter subunit A [Sterolibacterium sp.]
MSLVLIVLLPFLGSLCAAGLPANARNAEAWLAGAVCAAVGYLLIDLHPQLTSAAVLSWQWHWIPQLGLTFSLRLDGFAWLFALLISLMGLLVVIYARYYMSPQDPVPRFFAFFLAFMGAMLGVVLSGNLIQLVLFWEITSLTSFMLISYWHHRSEARRGARMALVITGLGGLSLLAGVLLLGHIVGSHELDQVLTARETVQNHPWYPLILILIALGALSKSAQFPFHVWLPQAMAAPTPVSAYLHSATMVKAGVFLLARLWPVLAGSELWFWLIAGAGLCSLLLAAWLAMFQQDMKGVLAYSTISHLGLITLLLGLNSELALVAAVFHILNHATFKATLFMAAGIVDHETGTRDLTRLSGLARAMPLTAALATVAAAAMAGVPLLNGFLSKEMFFAETVFIHRPLWQQWLLPLLATLAAIFSVAYSLRLIAQVFFGPPPPADLPHQPQEPTRWMLLPSLLLVAACLLVGIFPEQSIGPLLRQATTAILGAATPSYSLALWHGLNAPLLMSSIALLGGGLLYAHALAGQRWKAGPQLDSRQLFETGLRRLTAWAMVMRLRLTSSRLQTQLLLIFITALLGLFWFAAPLDLQPGSRAGLSLEPAFALLWLVGGSCALGVAWQAKYHRLSAIILAAGAGLCTALTFVWLSAPDLALTQLAVEAVTTVLILLGLRWLPQRDEDLATTASLKIRLRRLRDLSLAAGCGLGLAILSYVVMTLPPASELSDFFLSSAQPLGGGRNVVNVILVDFRGFDTLGEISVLAIVALTVYALLKRFRPAAASLPAALADSPQRRGANLALPAVLARLVLPLAVLISFYLLLRGHDAPGGGFVGGLVLATALILQYLVAGALWLESRLQLRPLAWLAGGLLLAAAAGLTASLYGQAFLSSLSHTVELPLMGSFQLGSVLFFDLGVYALVVGATLLILVALAHQSLRTPEGRAAQAAFAQLTLQEHRHAPQSSSEAAWN